MSRFFSVIFIVFFSFFAKAQTIYLVTNTNTSGAGSLSQAIKDANCGSGGIIHFNIPGAPPHVITPGLCSAYCQRMDCSTRLLLEKPIIIDGTTQPANGYTGLSPRIILDGINQQDNMIRIASSNCEIYGLTIKNVRRGIVIGGYASDPLLQNFKIWDVNKGNEIIQCIFGINVLGSNCTISNNYTGTNFSEQQNLGNSAPEFIVKNTLIKENIISGNEFGIDLQVDTNTVIQNNWIGTNKGGTTIIPYKAIDESRGINIVRSHNLAIGGASDKGNIIAGQDYGIIVFYHSVMTLSYNKIGTDVTGTYALPNKTGIDFSSGVNSGFGSLLPVTIGNNLISGNSNYGINAYGRVNIYRNKIGTAGNGIDKLGNGTGINTGGMIQVGKISNASYSNIIAWNKIGISVGRADSICIRNNSIFNNELAGISGGYYQNPVNDLPAPAVTVTGTFISGTTKPNFKIDLYYNHSGNGLQGKTFITTVTASVTGSM